MIQVFASRDLVGFANLLGLVKLEVINILFSFSISRNIQQFFW